MISPEMIVEIVSGYKLVVEIVVEKSLKIHAVLI